MIYKRPFWDENKHIIAISQSHSGIDVLEQENYKNNRGMFYMFWNVSKAVGKPCLIGVLTGEAAVQMANETDDSIVEAATASIESVYPEVRDTTLVESIVTRWQVDPFSRGSYSYVGLEATPADYDLLARPIGESLFFAGEATSRSYPATVHGAYISGLRAANEVLTSMIGEVKIPHPLCPTKDYQVNKRMQQNSGASTNGLTSHVTPATSMVSTPTTSGVVDSTGYVKPQINVTSGIGTSSAALAGASSSLHQFKTSEFSDVGIVQKQQQQQQLHQARGSRQVTTSPPSNSNNSNNSNAISNNNSLVSVTGENVGYLGRTAYISSTSTSNSSAVGLSAPQAATGSAGGIVLGSSSASTAVAIVPTIATVPSVPTVPEENAVEARLRHLREERVDADNDRMRIDMIKEIGERPIKPERSGANPFLIFQKDFWDKCRKQCDVEKQKKMDDPHVRAARNEVRAALGKMWRELPEEEKKPYLEKTKFIKESNNKKSEEYREKARRYKTEVEEFRKRWKEENPSKPSEEELKLQRMIQEEKLQEKKQGKHSGNGGVIGSGGGGSGSGTVMYRSNSSTLRESVYENMGHGSKVEEKKDGGKANGGGNSGNSGGSGGGTREGFQQGGFRLSSLSSSSPTSSSSSSSSSSGGVVAGESGNVKRELGVGESLSPYKKTRYS